MASTLPSASIGSRTGKPTFSILTLDSSMPFSFTNAFHCAKAPSAAGAPSTRPSRAFRLAMPVLAAVPDGEGRLADIIHTALALLFGVLSPNLASRVESEEADRHVSAAHRAMPGHPPGPQ